jgi:hypothetical protein
MRLENTRFAVGLAASLSIFSGCSSDGGSDHAGSGGNAGGASESGGMPSAGGEHAGTGGVAPSAGGSGAAPSAGGSGEAPGAGGGPSSGGSATGTASGGTSAGGAPDDGDDGGLGGADAGEGGGAAGGPSRKPYKGVANSPCAARTALKTSWYYNWMQSENEPCKDGAGGEFVPMIWGHTGAERSASGIQNAVSSFVSKKLTHVLGFNEPDNSTQSNVPVAEAITLLPSFDNPSIQVGTPATQANTSGQDWFKNYMGQVAAKPSLRADFIAIHWYGWNAGSCDKNASQLESYIRYAEGFPGNRPIWLTEWSCLNQSAPTRGDVQAFYAGAVTMLKRHPRVERYAWYPWTTNCELNEKDGSLTPLGLAYSAAESDR